LAVVSHARLNALLLPERGDGRTDRAGVGAHDLAAAMGEDGAANALFPAPGELSADRWIMSRPRRRTIDRVTVAPSPI
jgi:hypothetical protein